MSVVAGVLEDSEDAEDDRIEEDESNEIGLEL